jgi:flagellar biosynthetic protein FliQ
MTPEAASGIIGQALVTCFWVAAPLLAIAFIAGLLINIAQIVTSLQDSAFSTIPRLLVFLVGTLLLMPWMMRKMISYTLALLGDFARYAR